MALNRDEARQLLAAFLAESLHWGKRCVRIVHGKGLRSPQKISILRQLVRGWLMQRDEVLAYCQAKPQDGGEERCWCFYVRPKNKGQPEPPIRFKPPEKLRLQLRWSRRYEYVPRAQPA
jgi:DNA-nicking Smr family endonuclease